MKIKTRLRLNTWIYIIVILLIAISLTWSFWDLGRVARNEKLVLAILETAFERITLRDDYLLHQEERTNIQWQAKSEALRKLLKTASARFTTAEEKALLHEIQQSFDMTFSAFLPIIETQKREGRRTNKKFAFDEAQSRLISQVFLNSYVLIDNIERLIESTERKAKISRNRAAFMVIFLFAGGGMVIAINSILLNRTVSKRLTLLACGIKIIGDGNLGHQIVTAGDDELTDLARASNEMAAKLKQSYTSMERLQKEITERKHAEEEIKNITLHQQALIKALPDIVMEVNINKIYIWANEPGIEFFGKDVIGREAASYFVNEQKTYDIVKPIFVGSEDTIYVESWQKRKDGQERMLAWQSHVLKNANGNVVGALSSARDITDEYLAREEIKILNQELEQRVAARTEELLAKTTELERINKIFVDRELRMRELKERIAELEKKT